MPAGSRGASFGAATSIPRRCTRSAYGRCRSAWSERGSTTWSPTGGRSRPVTTRTSPPSGRAGWESGVRWLGGLLGMWIGCRRAGLSFWVVADCAAPGVILAQALGRWGNYANQELYGGPSHKPWAVKIDNPPFPYSATPGPHTFVAHVPLRIAVGPAGVRHPDLVRAALLEAHPAGHGIRALRRSLLRWDGSTSRRCGSTPPTCSSASASTCGSR